MTEAFYGPRSRENARRLLDTAERLGIEPRLIRTQIDGYSVPEEVVDAINAENDERRAAEAEAEAQAEEERLAAEKAAGEAQGEQKQEEPKRPSQGDSKADWLAYAQAKSLDVTEDTTKADIIEAVKKAEETD